MTKNITKESKKKQTRRSKTKYPNLKKSMNLKARRDYIETHYVNGMKSVTGDGSEGIRALTVEEKEWLNTFYGEYVNASFTKSDLDIHSHDEGTEQRIMDVRDALTMYKAKIKKNKMAKEDWIAYNDFKDELYEIDYYKNSTDRNNQRNRCLYNETKKRGMLVKRSPKEMDDDTIKKYEGHDLELAIAVNSELLWGKDSSE